MAPVRYWRHFGILSYKLKWLRLFESHARTDQVSCLYVCVSLCVFRVFCFSSTNGCHQDSKAWWFGVVDDVTNFLLAMSLFAANNATMPTTMRTHQHRDLPHKRLFLSITYCVKNECRMMRWWMPRRRSFVPPLKIIGTSIRTIERTVWKNWFCTALNSAFVVN